MSEGIDEGSYREMVAAQGEAQVDTWAADLFIDFAKRLGVGLAIASFCEATGLDARAFQRAFLVGGGPDHVVGIDTAGSLAAPIFELPKAIAGLRGRIQCDDRARVVIAPILQAAAIAAEQIDLRVASRNVYESALCIAREHGPGIGSRTTIGFDCCRVLLVRRQRIPRPHELARMHIEGAHDAGRHVDAEAVLDTSAHDDTIGNDGRG